MYPFSNLNAATIDVLEWIRNFIPQFTGHVITTMLGLKSAHVNKRAPAYIASNAYVWVNTCCIDWSIYKYLFTVFQMVAK